MELKGKWDLSGTKNRHIKATTYYNYASFKSFDVLCCIVCFGNHRTIKCQWQTSTSRIKCLKYIFTHALSWHIPACFQLPGIILNVTSIHASTLIRHWQIRTCKLQSHSGFALLATHCRFLSNRPAMAQPQLLKPCVSSHSKPSSRPPLEIAMETCTNKIKQAQSA